MKSKIFVLSFALVLSCAYAYAGELLNGDFEDGMEPWSEYINSAATATVTLVNTGGAIGSSCVHVNITATSGTNWHVGVTQDAVTVMAGKTYTATLFLKANKARQASLEIKRSPSEGGWEGIASGGFDITTEWAEYFTTFTPTLDYPDTAFFGVWVAQETGDIWVDGCHLYEGEYLAASAVEPESKLTTTWGSMKANR